MMHRSAPRLRLALAAAVFLLAGGAARAADVDPFTGYLDLGTNSLGGKHVALAGGLQSLFSNPAGLAAAEPVVSAARLGLGLSGPVFDIANILISSDNYQADLVNLLSSSGYKLYAAADLSGPISFAYVGQGLGFGIFNDTRVVIDVKSVTSVKVSLTEDVLIVGGYGFRIPTGEKSALDLGFAAKGYVRGAFVLNGGLLELMGLMAAPENILGQPFVLTTGIGLDAGIRWNWDEVVAVGLSCMDAYSPSSVSTYSNISGFIGNPASSLTSTTAGLVHPDLGFGLMWKPPLGVFGRVFDGLTFLLDYDDILDLFAAIPRNAILNVDLGVEARILEILSIRVGVREALPQAGVYFDLAAFKMGVSAWGDELGYEPGERPIYNLALSFDFEY
jgi:hypothetical protein